MSELDSLRRQIETIEGRTRRFEAMNGVEAAPAWTTGLHALDTALPGGALAFDACHDITPTRLSDVPQAAGFAIALLTRLPRQGPVVWCQTRDNAREYGRLYPPGLMDVGLAPERLIFVSVPKARDLPLVLEEAVRVPQLAAVVGEGPAPDFTASRRLTLAAQANHVPCVVLNTSGVLGASAATTRWRVAPIVGPPDMHDPTGPGRSAWRVELARARGANAALNPTIARPLDVTFDHETFSFHPLPPLRHGATLPRENTHDAVSEQRHAWGG